MSPSKGYLALQRRLAVITTRRRAAESRLAHLTAKLDGVERETRLCEGQLRELETIGCNSNNNTTSSSSSPSDPPPHHHTPDWSASSPAATAFPSPTTDESSEPDSSANSIDCDDDGQQAESKCGLDGGGESEFDGGEEPVKAMTALLHRVDELVAQAWSDLDCEDWEGLERFAEGIRAVRRRCWIHAGPGKWTIRLIAEENVVAEMEEDQQWMFVVMARVQARDA
ncbi:uncharacterized protein MYCGRDRAFT_97909 [Zymoseptoria tritici IPO323]|uniref:Uncharacterized protein n=1 Tax=Zymoseptoria tritici (strain CBS 115943 / IPO323) TaxID=336722 RepID=F9XRR4_ZYMTI|nr:uncharacterized protein MYCGRDRAFT_97909 [Zymoseptoria tritici IPO323]EGP82083.1 hypothetical protein MYCGRDRAFT_97909 [Zymoseptoria tritici IPO323]